MTRHHSDNIVCVRQCAPEGGWRHVTVSGDGFAWTDNAKHAARTVSDQWSPSDLLDAMMDWAHANREADKVRPGQLPLVTMSIPYHRAVASQASRQWLIERDKLETAPVRVGKAA